jgi:RNA polymerase sigma-70 factor (sigma-E family)
VSISWSADPVRTSDRAPARQREESSVPDRDEVADFDAFVHATGRRLHRAALLLCGGDHHLAEDLTQATYTKVFVAWVRVRGADDPVAYAHRVLTRTFLSHRRLRRSGERPTDVLPEQAVDPAGDPGGDPAVRLDLWGALAMLSAHDRAVLVLRFWLDLDVGRTAEIVGIGEPAVRQRTRRALVRLRQHVPDLDVDVEPVHPVPVREEL